MTAETTEQLENLSYGAHSIRDGVSLSPQTRTKPLTLPTEIVNLQDFEAFIKLPGPYPICKTRLTYKSLPTLTESFRPISESELLKRQQKLESFTIPPATKQATHKEKAK